MFQGPSFFFYYHQLLSWLYPFTVHKKLWGQLLNLLLAGHCDHSLSLCLSSPGDSSTGRRERGEEERRPPSGQTQISQHAGAEEEVQAGPLLQGQVSHDSLITGWDPQPPPSSKRKKKKTKLDTNDGDKELPWKIKTCGWRNMTRGPQRAEVIVLRWTDKDKKLPGSWAHLALLWTEVKHGQEELFPGLSTRRMLLKKWTWSKTVTQTARFVLGTCGVCHDGHWMCRQTEQWMTDFIQSVKEKQVWTFPFSFMLGFFLFVNVYRAKWFIFCIIQVHSVMWDCGRHISTLLTPK